MSLRIEAIRASDGQKKIDITENHTNEKIKSIDKIFTMFLKSGQFKGFALYNNDTNELIFKKGNI